MSDINFPFSAPYVRFQNLTYDFRHESCISHVHTKLFQTALLQAIKPSFQGVGRQYVLARSRSTTITITPLPSPYLHVRVPLYRANAAEIKTREKRSSTHQ